ncbi:MAG: hypothetical protein HC875_22085 [Anaerolineales bacterium]|nr:hypothetical protein [Anaerolineales bacterium]
MEIRQDFEGVLDPYTTLMPRAWDEQLARWISNLGSPPLLATVGIALSVSTIGTVSAWLWAVFYIVLAVSLPAAYVLWLVKRGEVTDFDLRLREQRLRPFLATLASTLIAWLVLYWGHAPYLLTILAGAGWVQIALLLGITLHWKISAHCATAAGFIVFTLALLGSAAAPLILVLPLIAWARIRLHRHDLPQTIAGSLMGATILGSVLYLAG